MRKAIHQATVRLQDTALSHHLNRFYLIYSSVLLIVRRVSAKESKEHFDFMLLKSMFGNKYQVFI
ncbi:hypothetical protein GQ033_000939 [Salmonella enterica]|nr:hypothetical protein [Salmonella enterica]